MGVRGRRADVEKAQRKAWEAALSESPEPERIWIANLEKYMDLAGPVDPPCVRGRNWLWPHRNCSPMPEVKASDNKAKSRLSIAMAEVQVWLRPRWQRVGFAEGEWLTAFSDLQGLGVRRLDVSSTALVSSVPNGTEVVVPHQL